jgi:hypothetical protein
MSKTPDFLTKREKRLSQVEADIQKEYTGYSKIVQSTFTMEASLLYAVREIAFKRKQLGIQPNTIKDMIIEAFQEIVAKEKGTKAE